MYKVVIISTNSVTDTDKANEAIEKFINAESEYNGNSRIFTSNMDDTTPLLNEFISNFRYYRMLGVSIGVPDARMKWYFNGCKKQIDTGCYICNDLFGVYPFDGSK